MYLYICNFPHRKGKQRDTPVDIMVIGVVLKIGSLDVKFEGYTRIIFFFPFRKEKNRKKPGQEVFPLNIYIGSSLVTCSMFR